MHSRTKRGLHPIKNPATAEMERPQPVGSPHSKGADHSNKALQQ